MKRAGRKQSLTGRIRGIVPKTRLQGPWLPHLIGLRLKPEERFSVEFADWCRAHVAPDVIWFHIPSEAKRSKATWAVLLGMGWGPGIADYIFTRGTVTVFIELKAHKNVLSDGQREFARACQRANTPFYEARRLSQCQEILERHGLLRGQSPPVPARLPRPKPTIDSGAVVDRLTRRGARG